MGSLLISVICINLLFQEALSVVPGYFPSYAVSSYHQDEIHTKNLWPFCLEHVPTEHDVYGSWFNKQILYEVLDGYSLQNTCKFNYGPKPYGIFCLPCKAFLYVLQGAIPVVAGLTKTEFEDLIVVSDS
jgi:hypothetical protein